VGDIEEFEPRKRYTPGVADVPPRIYASGNPAFAAAHSFPWSSDEGVDLSLENGQVLLRVPERIKSRLDQPVYIYTFDPDSFSHTSEEKMEETYHSEQKVKPHQVVQFRSVTEAVSYFGGVVEVVPD